MLAHIPLSTFTGHPIDTMHTGSGISGTLLLNFRVIGLGSNPVCCGSTPTHTSPRLRFSLIPNPQFLLPSLRCSRMIVMRLWASAPRVPQPTVIKGQGPDTNSKVSNLGVFKGLVSSGGVRGEGKKGADPGRRGARRGRRSSSLPDLNNIDNTHGPPTRLLVFAFHGVVILTTFAVIGQLLDIYNVKPIVFAQIVVCKHRIVNLGVRRNYGPLPLCSGCPTVHA